MKTPALSPTPVHHRRFCYASHKFIPAVAGCYALASVYDDVLYVGMSDNLQRRFGQHLDDEGKTEPTSEGRAAWFYWYQTDQPGKVEKMWMNCHIKREGKLPLLNKSYSPH